MHSPPVRRHYTQGLLAALLWCWCAWLLAAGAARAQGVELATLQTSRAEGSLNLEFVEIGRAHV